MCKSCITHLNHIRPNHLNQLLVSTMQWYHFNGGYKSITKLDRFEYSTSNFLNFELDQTSSVSSIRLRGIVKNHITQNQKRMHGLNITQKTSLRDDRPLDSSPIHQTAYMEFDSCFSSLLALSNDRHAIIIPACV